ncbi:MAG: hypothetical protein JWN56_2496 [Sphingobacteriales bacterium]|nr:hypothetical protein [Sphingobacteriales bacterium]
MKNCRLRIFNNKQRKFSVLFCLICLFFSFTADSQITIFPVQDFNFGTFYQGNSGGTVDISTAGLRSATGGIILLNTGPAVAQAIFDIEAPAGSNISINTPDAILTGSNGGTLTLHITGTDPGSPFSTIVAPPGLTRLQVSGSLVIGDQITSPPGAYQGTFSVTFNQE